VSDAALVMRALVAESAVAGTVGFVKKLIESSVSPAYRN
jgi:hypothetical protein